ISDGPPPLEVADRLQNPHEHLLGGVEGVLPVAKEGVGTPVDAHLIPVEKEGELLRPPLLAQAYDLVVRVHGLLPRSRRSGAGGLELWTRIPKLWDPQPPVLGTGHAFRQASTPLTGTAGAWIRLAFHLVLHAKTGTVSGRRGNVGPRSGSHRLVPAAPTGRETGPRPGARDAGRPPSRS